MNRLLRIHYASLQISQSASHCFQSFINYFICMRCGKEHRLKLGRCKMNASFQHSLEIFCKKLQVGCFCRNIVFYLLVCKENTCQRRIIVYLIWKTFFLHDLLQAAVKLLTFGSQIFVDFLMLIEIFQLCETCSHGNRVSA